MADGRGAETKAPGAPEPAAPPEPVAARTSERPHRRPLLVRLFAISAWGTVKLAFLCVLVGLVVMAVNFDPRSPEVDLTATAASLARQAWNAAGWALTHLWQPALAGASVVLPVWVLWRLISLPFRK